MKDYLSSQDRDELICTMHMLNNLESMIEKRNTYTKDEITNMKKGVTFSLKAIKSILVRQNKTSARALNNMISSTKAYLDYGSIKDIYFKKKSVELEAAFEENKEYYKMVELTMHYCCRECKECSQDCLLYEEFEAQYIPTFDGAVNTGECKYSYDFIRGEK